MHAWSPSGTFPLSCTTGPKTAWNTTKGTRDQQTEACRLCETTMHASRGVADAASIARSGAKPTQSWTRIRPYSRTSSCRRVKEHHQQQTVPRRAQPGFVYAPVHAAAKLCRMTTSASGEGGHIVFLTLLPEVQRKLHDNAVTARDMAQTLRRIPHDACDSLMVELSSCERFS